MATATQTQTTLENHELSSPAQWEPQARTQAVSDPQLQPPEGKGSGLSRGTYFKILSAGFSFLTAGVNDGSIGALVPYIIRDYNVSTAIVSSVYGATFAGWVFAALTNTHLCQAFDLGAMLAIGGAFQLVAHALRAWMPPFGLFVVTFWMVAIGQAYNDTQANAFVAEVKGAHRWLAFIHACYMGGCLIGPFVATGVASAGEVSRWYLFYTFPVGICVANLVFIAWAFWDTFGLKRKATTAAAAAPETSGSRGVDVEQHGVVEGEQQQQQRVSRNKDAVHLIKSTLSHPGVWLLSMFYFFYIGSVITMSGWVVEYLVEVRNGKLSQMGYVPAGFSGGALLGRLLLAEPTYRLGERRMVFAYLAVAVALQLVFWLVPNIIAASIAISFIGFVTGPLFATGMSLGSKLFAPEIYPTALAFVFVFAQMGGSLFPVMTGVVASRAGVQVLQPILVAILVATTVSWLLVPRPKTSRDNIAALHQE